MDIRIASANSLPAPGRLILAVLALSLAGVAAGPARAQVSPICCEDFTGHQAGLPDREVNVIDLLGLLSNWGATAPTNPGPDIGPLSADGCPAGGDGTVDVVDLLALLAAWGPCDSKVDQCTKALDPANAYARISADGTYPFRINGLLDGPRRGPTNDSGECLCGASTCGWANFGPDGIPGGFQFGDTFGIDMRTDPFTEGGDVWFHYTAPGNGSAFFETVSGCGPGELTDTLIDVFTGDVCPAGAWSGCSGWPEFVTCNQDSELFSCEPIQSSIRLDVLQGETYIIRIGGWLGEQGDGSLKTTFLDNSIFENALPIELGTSLLGSTVNAHIPVAPSCAGVDVVAPGRWYRAEGYGGLMKASTRCFGSHPCLSDDWFLFDVRLSIFTSTDGTAAGLTCLDAANDDVCDLNESITWATEVGETYYILVHGTPNLSPPFLSEGPYELELYSPP